MRSRIRRTEGATLIVSVLLMLLVLMMILSVTATISLSARRTTRDQQAAQQAQTASESGLALAFAKIQQARVLMDAVSIPQGTTLLTIQNLLAQYCGKPLTSTTTYPADACKDIPSVTTLDRMGIFKNYVPSSIYTALGIASSDVSTYWDKLFGYGNPQVAGTSAASGTAYTANFSLIPTRVVQTGPLSFKVMYRSAPFSSTGTLNQSSTTAASRKVSVTQSNETYVLIRQPSLNYFAQFRNKTSSTSGGALNFADGETFDGPVHTNERPNFSGNPILSDQFSTAATTANVSNVPSGCSTAGQMASGSCTEIFTNKLPQFGVPAIALPTNNNNQLRASFGGDPTNTNGVSNTELAAAWNVSGIASNTVYYASGNGSTTANSGSQWLGGLYINGNANLTFDLTADGRQIMNIVQANATTVFTKQTDGTWTVAVNNGTPKTLSGSFNGMIFANGNLNVAGDGDNTTADLASDSQFTVTNAGSGNNILIKNSITYADDPLTNPDAANVLGIYSGEGNVLLDGPMNQDLIVNASILAGSSGHGFGSVNPANLRYSSGGSQPLIKITGGVIEDQSQTVSSSPGGYKRKYTYDGRFKTGFSPPYFPLQQRWTSDNDPTTVQFGFWSQTQ